MGHFHAGGPTRGFHQGLGAGEQTAAKGRLRVRSTAATLRPSLAVTVCCPRPQPHGPLGHKTDALRNTLLGLRRTLMGRFEPPPIQVTSPPLQTHHKLGLGVLGLLQLLHEQGVLQAAV